jgi:hypothetical protein
MSKASQAKSARRKKRRAARGAVPLPGEPPVDDVTLVDDEIMSRDWEFDVDNSTDEVATWFYPPSGVELEDETVEPVTRIWLAAEDDQEWHVMLVGSGETGVDYVFSAESLLDYLDEIEAYRLGDAEPAFE